LGFPTYKPKKVRPLRVRTEKNPALIYPFPSKAAQKKRKNRKGKQTILCILYLRSSAGIHSSGLLYSLLTIL
jgi:hypothetical protein